MGNYFIPISPFSGGTVTGDTYFSSSLSAATFYSGGTQLENIFYDITTGATSNIYSYWTSGNSGNYSVKVINDTSIDSIGDYSYAEGAYTLSSGLTSHAEGSATVAAGDSSHAQGFDTLAFGETSHAGGYSSVAIGDVSFVHGRNSVSNGESTIVLGSNITGDTDNMTYVNALTTKNEINVFSGGTLYSGITGTFDLSATTSIVVVNGIIINII
jgi:hypothetical protein